MKIDFDVKNITEFLKKQRKYFLVSLIVLLVSMAIYAAYSLLTIEKDPVVVSDSQNRIDSVIINYDKSFLENLEMRSTPVEVKEVGGRNPFLPF